MRKNSRSLVVPASRASLGLTACGRGAAAAAQVAVLMLASLACARAQSYSMETGASFYASTAPHAAGHFSVLKDMGDGKTFSITSIEMRGNGNGQPVYTPMTGVARLVQSAGRVSFWGLGQGGLAVSDSAVSGLFNGGGAVAIGLTKQVELVVTGQAVRAPALPRGWEPMVMVGLRLHPQEQ